jgi:hypothetical protein
LALDSFSEFVKLLPVDDARLEALVEATAFNGCMFSPAADGQANRFISRYGYDLLRFTGKPANGEDHDSALTELVVLCQSDDDELIAEALSELEGAS